MESDSLHKMMMLSRIWSGEWEEFAAVIRAKITQGLTLTWADASNTHARTHTQVCQQVLQSAYAHTPIMDTHCNACTQTYIHAHTHTNEHRDHVTAVQLIDGKQYSFRRSQLIAIWHGKRWISETSCKIMVALLLHG